MARQGVVSLPATFEGFVALNEARLRRALCATYGADTGREATVEDLGGDYAYRLDDEPPEVRARFAPEVEEIKIHAFAAEAPGGWEPSLDEEHVGYRWCSADDAIETLEYEEPRAAVRETARRLGAAT